VVIVAFLLHRHNASPLSTKKIQILMHDPARLHPDPFVEQSYVGCSIRLPLECEPAKYYTGGMMAARSPNLNMSISTNEWDGDKTLAFEPYVIDKRNWDLGPAFNPVVLEEGFATLDGHRAYSLTCNTDDGPAHRVTARHVYVEGNNGKIYGLYFACSVDQWNNYADIIDSSIASFHMLK